MHETWRRQVETLVQRGDRWRPAVKLGLSVAGAVQLGVILVNPGQTGYDLFGYWMFDPAHPYREAMGGLDAMTAFRYSPPVALALLPLHAMPWPTFHLLWTMVLLGALTWLCGTWTLAVIAFYPVALELAAGNVNILLAAALVAGLRWPAAWAFLLLTKVTPGVALVWYAVRREWAPLSAAVGVTAILAIGSAAIAPSLWPQWLAMLTDSASLPEAWIPLWLRGTAAATLVAWGARRDRRWVLPVGSS